MTGLVSRPRVRRAGEVLTGTSVALRQRAVRRAAAALPFLLLGALLAAGFALKWPCADLEWDGAQYRRYCYSDAFPLYGLRGLDEPGLPYVTEGKQLEYPAATGLLLWSAARLSHDAPSFFAAGAVLLSLCAFATLALVASLRPDLRSMLRFAAAPSLAWAAFLNWDLLAVLFATAALWAHLRGKPLVAGVMLGLGASAKFWPALLAPILLIALLRRDPATGTGSPHERATRFAMVGKLVVGGLAGWLALNLPFLAADPAGWWWTYDFHLGRGPTLESVWWAVPEWLGLSGSADAGWLRVLPAGLIGLLYGIVLWRVATGRAGALQGSFEALLAFLLASPVMSVQFALWLVPLLALLSAPWRLWAAAEAGGLLVFVAVFAFFTDPDLLPWLALATLLRHVAYVWLLAGSWRGGAGLVEPAREPPGPVSVAA